MMFRPARGARRCERRGADGVKLHVEDAQGNGYVGMDASRALYATLGYRRWVKLSCLPGLRGVLNAGDSVFARYRVGLGRWYERARAVETRIPAAYAR